MAREMTKNYYFRKFQCGLSKKDTAKLCFKSVRTVTRWDSGQPIPPECRRLMKMNKGIELVNFQNEWEGWMFKKGYLVNEQGIKLTPQQILTGYALLEIGAENDRIKIRDLIRISRSLQKIIKT
ncbi:DUF3653 domain-containing protein [Photobacterium leiognathi]|uniref:DUF3653 domain-containing protein n=1 Tax=Photobacterium leiognathi TaxID=553611 RepID=UPI002981B2FD|nr:DUF3653 domain-containing protein [Photobacterium leiognathi]